MKDRSSHEILPDDKPVPFFPDHLMTEFWVAVGFVGVAFIIGFLGMLHPIGLQAPADPLNTPLHVKPEWYFLFLYQFLKLVPGTLFWGQVDGRQLVVVTVAVGLLAFMLFPIFDKKEDTKQARNRRAIYVAIAVVIVIALTIWGEVS